MKVMDVSINENEGNPDSFDFSFPKEARLHHLSLVNRLFKDGKSFYEFPLRIVWNTLSEEELTSNFRNKIPDGIGKVQFMVTVPKKKRKRAVDRVKMRRRIKESYRLNRHLLLEEVENSKDIRTLSIGVVYIHNENLPYSVIENKMNIVINRICGMITKIIKEK